MAFLPQLGGFIEKGKIAFLLPNGKRYIPPNQYANSPNIIQIYGEPSYVPSHVTYFDKIHGRPCMGFVSGLAFEDKGLRRLAPSGNYVFTHKTMNVSAEFDSNGNLVEEYYLGVGGNNLHRMANGVAKLCSRRTADGFVCIDVDGKQYPIRADELVHYPRIDLLYTLWTPEHFALFTAKFQ